MLRDLKGLSLLDGHVPTLSDTVELAQRSKTNSANAAESAVQKKDEQKENLRVDPTLGVGPALSAPSFTSTGKGAGSDSGFSREAYLKEVRESLFGRVLASLVVLIFVLAGLFVLGNDILAPEFSQLKQKQSTIADLPLALKTVDAQLALQQKKLETIVEQNARLMNYFPDSQDIEISYVDFLNSLESHKVNVIGQSSSVTQASVSPLYASYKASGDDKKPMTTHAGKSRAVNLSGAVTTGLNYYHVEIAVQGSYVGYLSARQALVNANPNLIVHAETINASASTPGQMDMVLFASLPFLSQP